MVLKQLKFFAEVGNYHSFYHCLMDSDLPEDVKEDLIEAMLWRVSFGIIGIESHLVDTVDKYISKEE